MASRTIIRRWWTIPVLICCCEISLLPNLVEAIVCFNCVSSSDNDATLLFSLLGLAPKPAADRHCRLPFDLTTPTTQCTGRHAQCYELLISGYNAEFDEPYQYFARGCRDHVLGMERSIDKCESGYLDSLQFELPLALGQPFVQHVICSEDLCNTNIARLECPSDGAGIEGQSSLRYTVCQQCSFASGGECVGPPQECHGNWCFKRSAEISSGNWRHRSMSKGCSPVNLQQSQHCASHQGASEPDFARGGRRHKYAAKSCLCRGRYCNDAAAKYFRTNSLFENIFVTTIIIFFIRRLLFVPEY